jgi:hypothetical protein
MGRFIVAQHARLTGVKAPGCDRLITAAVRGMTGTKGGVNTLPYGTFEVRLHCEQRSDMHPGTDPLRLCVMRSERTRRLVLQEAAQGHCDGRSYGCGIACQVHG